MEEHPFENGPTRARRPSDPTAALLRPVYASCVYWGGTGAGMCRSATSRRWRGTPEPPAEGTARSKMIASRLRLRAIGRR